MRLPLPQRVASRFMVGVCRRVAREPHLEHWGLDKLVSGEQVTLYHGTTRTFHAFDLQKSRTELVDRFYGPGIFLTPSKRVAMKYADANRNIGFDPSIIDDLRSKNPKAAALMQDIYSKGDDVAWGLWSREALGLDERDDYIEALRAAVGGVDPNTIGDVASYILGSKSRPPGAGGPVMLFNQSTGLPDWVYANLDEIGLDSNQYRPKVYTVTVAAQNVLVTASKSEARSAKSKGFDAVVFHGTDLVDGVPEVAVFSPRAVKITHVEVV